MTGVKDLRNLDDETRSELWHLFIGSAWLRHRQLGLVKLHEDSTLLLRIKSIRFLRSSSTRTKGVGATCESSIGSI
jgi:hypothetical protein